VIADALFEAAAEWPVCVVVGEAEDAELGFDSVEGGTLDAVWIDGGERGGEADAGRLLDRMITLRRKSATCHIVWAIFEIKDCACDACRVHGTTGHNLRRSSRKRVRRIRLFTSNSRTSCFACAKFGTWSRGRILTARDISAGAQTSYSNAGMTYRDSDDVACCGLECGVADAIPLSGRIMIL
jgi:hypothetical protein